jgi:uncharacterized protein (TIGR03067 family)
VYTVGVARTDEFIRDVFVVKLLNPDTNMKTNCIASLICLATLTISSAWAAQKESFKAEKEDKEAIQKELAKMQGEWSMVSGSADGTAMPDNRLKQMKRICKGDETTTMMGGQVYFKAKITIDPSKKPKTIDYQMTEGFTKGKKQLGIYELDGDKFKSCFGKAGADRPKDFTSKSGDGRTLSLWIRDKKAMP